LHEAVYLARAERLVRLNDINDVQKQRSRVGLPQELVVLIFAEAEYLNKLRLGQRRLSLEAAFRKEDREGVRHLTLLHQVANHA
jgi:hypothetical protein